MSLINEALKRAKHAQKKDAPPLSSSAALRPTEPARPTGINPVTLLPLLFIALVVIGGCIVWIALRSDTALSTPQTVQAKSVPRSVAPSPKTESQPMIGQPVTAPSQPVAQPSPTVALATDSATPASAPAQSVPVESPTISKTTLTTAQQVVTASAPPPPPPMPKLQAIFYSPQRPTAVLDGRIVLIGKTVGEYRVVDISQESVTVVRAGQTNVLKMPD
jgi:hypothetical protein